MLLLHFNEAVTVNDVPFSNAWVTNSWPWAPLLACTPPPSPPQTSGLFNNYIIFFFKSASLVNITMKDLKQL